MKATKLKRDQHCTYASWRTAPLHRRLLTRGFALQFHRTVVNVTSVEARRNPAGQGARPHPLQLRSWDCRAPMENKSPCSGPRGPIRGCHCENACAARHHAAVAVLIDQRVKIGLPIGRLHIPAAVGVDIRMHRHVQADHDEQAALRRIGALPAEPLDLFRRDEPSCESVRVVQQGNRSHIGDQTPCPPPCGCISRKAAADRDCRESRGSAW